MPAGVIQHDLRKALRAAKNYKEAVEVINGIIAKYRQPLKVDPKKFFDSFISIDPKKY
jgi:hypothetical protein